jgi:hypothetical protein
VIDPDLAALHLRIRDFLKQTALEDTSREPRSAESGRDFWRSHPYITRREMGLLAELAEKPLCVVEFARRLGRTLYETRKFLDALVAIGVLDRDADRYSANPATILYLGTF